ncbi:hypothetical protein ACIQUU_07345 [Streptomyces sp. NPDC101116]|uniref:hypothetical protein n=1 Tax=Streptomyces sp. NPDC101116 TaxID=3366107 RepID=UPI003811F22F
MRAPPTPQPNVHVSAYRGIGSRLVVVAVNKETSHVSQQFVLRNDTSSGVSSRLTDSGRTLASQGRSTVTNGSLTGQLPARSVTTFVTG